MDYTKWMQEPYSVMWKTDYSSLTTVTSQTIKEAMEQLKSIKKENS